MKSILWMSIISLCWWRNFVLMMLLNLELVLLTTLVIINNSVLMSFSFINLFFLAMMVISSSLGLSIMISMSRSHGTSKCTSMSSLMYFNTTNTFI